MSAVCRTEKAVFSHMPLSLSCGWGRMYCNFWQTLWIDLLIRPVEKFRKNFSGPHGSEPELSASIPQCQLLCALGQILPQYLPTRLNFSPYQCREMHTSILGAQIPLFPASWFHVADCCHCGTNGRKKPAGPQIHPRPHLFQMLLCLGPNPASVNQTTLVWSTSVPGRKPNYLSVICLWAWWQTKVCLFQMLLCLVAN